MDDKIDWEQSIKAANVTVEQATDNFNQILQALSEVLTPAIEQLALSFEDLCNKLDENTKLALIEIDRIENNPKLGKRQKKKLIKEIKRHYNIK